MKYDVDYFIRKFSAIPENKWITRVWNDITEGRKCSLGHCGMNSEFKSIREIPEAAALMEIFNPISHWPPAINDGQDERYPQPTAKMRILAALNDIKNLEAKVSPEVTPSIPQKGEWIAVEGREQVIDEAAKEWGAKCAHNGTNDLYQLSMLNATKSFKAGAQWASTPDREREEAIEDKLIKFADWIVNSDEGNDWLNNRITTQELYSLFLKR